MPFRLNHKDNKPTPPEDQLFSKKLLKDVENTVRSSEKLTFRLLVFRYGLAIILPLIAFGLSLVGQTYLTSFDARFLIFFAAITLTAFEGGFGPTALSTIISIALLYYSLNLPQVTIPGKEISLQMIVFTFEGIALGIIAQTRLTAEAERAKFLLLEHQARQEAERSRDQRDDFIALASHEIKTPLTAIKGFNELLQKHLQKNKNPKVVEYLGFMKEQVDRLTTLVIDFLDTTKIRTGKLEINKVGFPFKDLLTQTVNSLEPTTNRHRIVVAKCDSIIIKADRTRIGQVLTNLLTNAVKYSLPSKQIIVTAVKDGDNLSVSVQDFGIGIDPEDQEHIFDSFYQSSDPARPSRGLGLGLYISSQIVRLHGGKIWVKSNKGEGSTFFFTLPGILGDKNE